MKILITAGGTTEKIDDVRTISNSSTGRLGAAIADAFANSEEACVDCIYYVHGQNAVVPASDKVRLIRIGDVSELITQLTQILTTEKIDAVIHSMAVSDYTVDRLTTKANVAHNISAFLKQNKQIKEADTHAISSQIVEEAFSHSNAIDPGKKISSDIDDLVIIMKKTPKVIGSIKKLQPKTLLVGFKLLSNVDLDTLIDIGHRLLLKNDCDLVLANDLSQINYKQHKGYLISPDKTYETFDNKEQIAIGIVKHIVKIFGNR